jgi:putative membrane protein|tara:strand:+ start:964 stop:1881 length:918 start_codon:yes stop_codon:yes gene_type:complete
MTPLGIFLRGMAMGAADVVPGVSGGTIALITGIYDRLINAISSADVELLGYLRNVELAKAWQHVDGTFLSILMAGIVTSIAMLASLIVSALATYPLLIWSFFFGLIFASAIFLMRQIKPWGIENLILLLIGIAIAVAVVFIKPVESDGEFWYLFAAGAIAICATILPGISGGFILVLLGAYTPVLIAVKEFDIVALAGLIAGASIGLLCFSKVLSWLLTRYHNRVMALLTGFLFGSLYLIWPWKQVLEWYTSSQGLQKPLVKQNLLPHNFEVITGIDPQLFECVLAMTLGLVILFVMEKVANGKA